MAFDVPFDEPHGTCVTALQPIVRQLEHDMAQWRIGQIDHRLLQQVYANISEAAVHAAIGIINRTVYYLRPLGRPRSAMLVSAVHDLQEAADAHPLPDVELMLNADDYPRVWRRSGRTALPVFSFVQTSSTADIVCPSGSFRESNYDSLLLGSAVYEEAFPWTSKSPVAFCTFDQMCKPDPAPLMLCCSPPLRFLTLALHSSSRYEMIRVQVSPLGYVLAAQGGCARVPSDREGHSFLWAALLWTLLAVSADTSDGSEVERAARRWADIV